MVWKKKKRKTGIESDFESCDKAGKIGDLEIFLFSIYNRAFLSNYDLTFPNRIVDFNDFFELMAYK